MEKRESKVWRALELIALFAGCGVMCACCWAWAYLDPATDKTRPIIFVGEIVVWLVSSAVITHLANRVRHNETPPLKRLLGFFAAGIAAPLTAWFLVCMYGRQVKELK